MNSYIIHHKIKTVANLGFQFDSGGYVFVPFDADKGFGSEEWLAAREIQADEFYQAILKFRLELIPILDALSVLTQCSFSMVAMSYFVYRTNHNNDGTFYLYVARDRKPVGMPFWEKAQIDDLNRLAKIENKVALHYLRESNNASTSKTRLAMLIFASEALAGQKPRTRKCPKCGYEEIISTSNRELLAEIVGAEAYERLYVKDAGALRHKLIHGSVVEDKDIVEVLPIVYNSVVLIYLPKTYHLTTIREIVSAPRSFTSFEHGGLFVRGKPQVPDLKFAEENWNNPSVLFPLLPAEAPKDY